MLQGKRLWVFNQGGHLLTIEELLPWYLNEMGI